jgi:hypothetical protein
MGVLFLYAFALAHEAGEGGHAAHASGLPLALVMSLHFR